MTAWMRSPSSSAACSGLSTTAATPLPKMVPSAPDVERPAVAERRHHRPRLVASSRPDAAPGSTTPPASTMSHSPLSRLWHAEVHGDQRRGAGGLHRHARSPQVELVRHPRGQVVLVVQQRHVEQIEGGALRRRSRSDRGATAGCAPGSMLAVHWSRRRRWIRRSGRGRSRHPRRRATRSAGTAGAAGPSSARSAGASRSIPRRTRRFR